MSDADTPKSEPDWERERCRGWWDPSRRLLRSIRRYQECKRKGGVFAGLSARRHVLSHRFWSVITGAEIALNCDIEGGLQMPHPNGIVITPQAHIGANCMMFQQVTIGSRGPRRGAPTIGEDVVIGAGAKVLGPISVGDRARIGANAVVLSDLPDGAVAVGVPARIVEKQPNAHAESDAKP